MVDSNTLASLHVLMNTGDALYDVRAELFHFERVPKFSTMRTKPFCVYAPTNSFSNLPESAKLEMHDPKGKCIRLLLFSHSTSFLINQLTRNIIAALDRLTSEVKKPLIDFAKGLAYQYNNLYMDIVG